MATMFLMSSMLEDPFLASPFRGIVGWNLFFYYNQSTPQWFESSSKRKNKIIK